MAERMEKAVHIVGRLYEARRGCRVILGDKYAAKVTEFMQIILERVTPDSDVMKTGMKCCELLTVGGYEVSAMLVLAAIVELLEPDAQSPPPPVVPS